MLLLHCYFLIISVINGNWSNFSFFCSRTLLYLKCGRWKSQQICTKNLNIIYLSTVYQYFIDIKNHALHTRTLWTIPPLTLRPTTPVLRRRVQATHWVVWCVMWCADVLGVCSACSCIVTVVHQWYTGLKYDHILNMPYFNTYTTTNLVV